MSYAPLHSVPRKKFFLGRRSNHINTTVSTLSEGSKVFQLKHVAWSELIVLYDSVSVAAALHLPYVPFPLCLIIADKPELQAASINTFPLELGAANKPDLPGPRRYSAAASMQHAQAELIKQLEVHFAYC